MTFTQTELDYLAGQPLGRLATAKPDGTLQVSPVGFTYNATLKTIDVHGYNMARSKKYRNVADNGRVAFVVDDLASTNPLATEMRRDPWAWRGGRRRQGDADHPHPSAASDRLRNRPGRHPRPQPADQRSRHPLTADPSS